MPNDAKLGLVIGVGLVIAVAVLFRRDGLATPAGARPTPSIAPVDHSPSIPPARVSPLPAITLNPLAARPMSWVVQRPHFHTVKEGETPFLRALRASGDGNRWSVLQAANRVVADSAEEVEQGKLVVVPALGTKERKVNGQPLRP